jgi:PKD repeat protein
MILLSQLFSDQKIGFMLRLFVSLLFSVVLCQASTAQDRADVLGSFFEESSVVNIPVNQALAQRKSTSNTIVVALPIEGEMVELVLSERPLYSPTYQGRAVGDAGEVIYTDHKRPIPTIGAVRGDLGSKASITLNEDFVYGRISTGGKQYYVEPLRHFYKQAKKSEYVVYDVTKVKQDAPATCGVTDAMRQGESIKTDVDNSRKNMMSCFEVEWAIANDFSMFQLYGSFSGVENHALGVANDVQTNYDDEFADELQFFISEIFVPTSSGQDPFPSTNNASTLLNFFANWGGGGFSFTHDVGSLWTERNIAFQGSNGTIGLAFVGVVCTGNRYNLLEDFSSNGNLKRVLVSHELGHNFDAVHDGGSNFIMSPSVNSSNTWSNNSISDIESHYLSRNCLATCTGTGGSAPTPGVDVTYFEQCASLPSGGVADVQFDDDSAGNPTSWSWSFEGGNPATSTLQDPAVLYDIPGLYDVTLTVTNSIGSNTQVFTDLVEIVEQPVAEFITSSFGTLVDFSNISFGGQSYSWSFGDGTFSSDFEPSHTYATDGTYTVTLIVINGVCDDIYTETITVISAPTASVASDVDAGCVSFDVQYDAGASINVASYDWLFQGGTPSTSSIANPSVTYDAAGVYDTRLIVTSPSGLKDTADLVDYITASDVPSGGFTVTNSFLAADFTYTGTGATSVTWDFGDGTTGSGLTTSHTYGSPDDYTVVMTATNLCGTITDQQIIDIAIPPSASFTSNFFPADVLCEGFVAAFVANDQNNLDTYQWTFAGGTPTTSTIPNPTVTYNVAGSYDVKLVVTNSIGTDSIIVSDHVVIEPAPIAAFMVIVNQLTATFTNTSADATTYSWDFGDGNSSTAPNPTHTYAMGGVYTVTLTATSACGTDVFTQQISANSTPIAGFTSDVTEGCVDLTVTYTQTSTGSPTAYQWSFEGGTPSTSTSPTPVVTYSTAGTYDVELTATNAAGSNTIMLADYIAARDVPIAALSATSTGNVITMIDNSVDADMVTYEVDGVAVAGATYTAPSNGTYTITQTATNDCGTTEATATIEITAYPTVTIDGPATISGCSPLTAVYEAVSSNATTFEWLTSGGSLSTVSGSSSTAAFDASGPYEISVVATNAFGTATATYAVTVDIIAPPTGDFMATTNAATVTCSAVDVGATSYTWDFGDGTTGTGAMASHTYTTSGEYTVTLIVVGECGTETSTQEVTIEVNNSVVDFDADVQSGCAPLMVNFMDFTTNNPTSWSWSFVGGTPATSTEQNPVVVYQQAGVYDVSLTVENSFGQSTGVKFGYVVVEDVPVAQATITTAGLSADFVSTGSAGTATTWDFGDGATGAGSAVSHTYEKEGTYLVSLIVENACGEDILTLEVNVMSTSTLQVEQGIKAEIYPNPVQDQLTIVTSPLARITLFDAQGQPLTTTSNLVTEDTYRVDMSTLSPGVYLVRIEVGEGYTYQRIVKL